MQSFPRLYRDLWIVFRLGWSAWRGSRDRVVYCRGRGRERWPVGVWEGAIWEKSEIRKQKLESGRQRSVPLGVGF